VCCRTKMTVSMGSFERSLTRLAETTIAKVARRQTQAPNEEDTRADRERTALSRNHDGCKTKVARRQTQAPDEEDTRADRNRTEPNHANDLCAENTSFSPTTRDFLKKQRAILRSDHEDPSDQTQIWNRSIPSSARPSRAAKVLLFRGREASFTHTGRRSDPEMISGRRAWMQVEETILACWAARRRSRRPWSTEGPPGQDWAIRWTGNLRGRVFCRFRAHFCLRCRDDWRFFQKDARVSLCMRPPWNSS